MNQVHLLGHIARDLEVKQGKENGKAYLQFALAVEDRKGGKEKKTYFIEVVAFHKQAETLAKYAAKGELLAIEGKLVSDSYINKDGQKMHTTKVILEEFHFINQPKKVLKAI